MAEPERMLTIGSGRRARRRPADAEAVAPAILCHLALAEGE
jgi:hypothetical protein